MNLYERIQRAIDYIEDRLDDEIDLVEVAGEAYMSRAGMYRLFNAFTGYDVKEYVRRRRLDNACREIEQSTPAVEIALKYGYGSQESFIKAFKTIVGTTPGNYKRGISRYEFRKVNIMEQLFEIGQDAASLKYPEIKVLSELPPMRVASYWTFSENPEEDGLKVIMEFARKYRLLDPSKGSRLFGFDYPAYFAQQRGYTYWLSLPAGFSFPGGTLLKEESVPAGMYALHSISYDQADFNDFFGKLMGAKARFAKWCRESNYGFAFHQYLEEHVIPVDVDGNTRRMNLYFPVGRDPGTKSPSVVNIPEARAAVIRVEGMESYNKAFTLYQAWSETSKDYTKHKILQIQDDYTALIGKSAELWVTNPPGGADAADIRTLPARQYLQFQTEFTSLESELGQCFELYRKKGYPAAGGKLIIEYNPLSPAWDKRTLVKLLYPI